MLSKEPARKDLTSRECAKLICGLLGGLATILHDDDMQMVREALIGTKERDTWGTPAGVRVSLRAIGALIGALRSMTSEDPEELDIAIKWVIETDEVWAKLKK